MWCWITVEQEEFTHEISQSVVEWQGGVPIQMVTPGNLFGPEGILDNPTREGIEWLRKTEQIDPDFPWVPLYLGYQLFDTANYADAYQQFDRVNREFFSSIEHHWRNLHRHFIRRESFAK